MPYGDGANGPIPLKDLPTIWYIDLLLTKKKMLPMPLKLETELWLLG